jgi:hypothetical protein
MNNAVEASPRGAEIWVRPSRDTCGPLSQVCDPVNRMPEPKSIELTLEPLDLAPERFDVNGGWGLSLVAALSQDHGCDPYPSGGKTSWARFRG